MFRYTHVLWLSTKYDAKGQYIAHWLPPLATLPEKLRPIAFLLTPEEQQEHDFVLGKDYPEPLLIPDAWQKMVKRLGRM